MRTIIAIRHGETEWNRAGRVQGWAPVPLNDHGHRQADALAHHLVEAGDDIDTVVASDLCRARETATYLRKAVGVDTIETRRGWRERHFGVYQGLTTEEFAEFDRFQYGCVGERAFREIPESGESWYGVRKRIEAAWDRLVYSTDGNVALITHTGGIGCLISALTEQGLGEAFVPGFDNCGITTITIGEDETGAQADDEGETTPGTGAVVDSVNNSSFLESGLSDGNILE